MMAKILLILLCTAGLAGLAPVRSAAYIPANRTMDSDTSSPSGNTVLAGRVAQKMSDTLSLSGDQSTQVYASTMWLDSLRCKVFRRYHSKPDSLMAALTWWSRQCDSAYRSILTDRQF